MLINDGTPVNLMSYFIFKKLGREDDEIVKTNLTLNGMGVNPMESRGVISMELAMGSKSLAEVQGNYSAHGRVSLHCSSQPYRQLVAWECPVPVEKRSCGI
jgi:hypothetical protein